MQDSKKNVLLISMPFAGIDIPSIQLSVLESYLKERNLNIKTKNLYLKAAEFYHINNYNFLIYPPNDSYTAQMVFSKYIFPEHWNESEEKIKQYFNKNAYIDENSNHNINFEEYVHRTDNFYDWTIKNIDWQSYDIIGFTLNYGQFLPSLAIAKKIKEIYPEKIIIFGGSRTTGELGKKVLETFYFIDFIVSGEGEEALFHLASNNQHFESIPNLIYRKQGKIFWNNFQESIDLNSLPIPNFDSFYEELENVSTNIQQFFQYYGRLPIEISRGCWWNKCSFCNLNLQYNSYKEKSIDRIIEEINFLSNRYKMLSFQIMGNTLPKSNYKELFEKIIEIGKDFSFVAEARAGILKSDDYYLMKQAGFDIIQTGIESFSQSYLKKMNKGVRLIDNIAALKFCYENGILNKYNLIINYPNEEKIDFEETVQNVQLFKQYIDPPQICHLKVLYNSPIQCNPDFYNIAEFGYSEIDKLMFPNEILERGFNFIYDFKRKEVFGQNNWSEFIEDWRNIRQSQEIIAVKSKNILDKLVLFYLNGKNFIKILDKRDRQNIQIYFLNDLERQVFLACNNVISFQELKDRFSYIDHNQLSNILNDFIQSGIIFKDDNLYLGLPLRYNQRALNVPEEKILAPIS